MSTEDISVEKTVKDKPNVPKVHKQTNSKIDNKDNSAATPISGVAASDGIPVLEVAPVEPTDAPADTAETDVDDSAVEFTKKPKSFLLGLICGVIVTLVIASVPTYLGVSKSTQVTEALTQSLTQTQASLLNEQLTAQDLQIGIATAKLGVLNGQLADILQKEQEYTAILDQKTAVIEAQAKAEKRLAELNAGKKQIERAILTATPELTKSTPSDNTSNGERNATADQTAQSKSTVVLTGAPSNTTGTAVESDNGESTGSTADSTLSNGVNELRDSISTLFE